LETYEQCRPGHCRPPSSGGMCTATCEHRRLWGTNARLWLRTGVHVLCKLSPGVLAPRPAVGAPLAQPPGAQQPKDPWPVQGGQQHLLLSHYIWRQGGKRSGNRQTHTRVRLLVCPRAAGQPSRPPGAGLKVSEADLQSENRHWGTSLQNRRCLLLHSAYGTVPAGFVPSHRRRRERKTVAEAQDSPHHRGDGLPCIRQRPAA
jgi:hypothetical protein